MLISLSDEESYLPTSLFISGSNNAKRPIENIAQMSTKITFN